MDAGVPRHEAMQMATRNLGEAMGLPDGIGTIREGQRAHFALYTADPQRFANISHGIENARAEKDAAEERWLELAEQAGA